MTVDLLRKFLEKLDGDIICVVESGDHSYRNAYFSIEDIERTGSGDMYEYYNDHDMQPKSKRIEGLVIR